MPATEPLSAESMFAVLNLPNGLRCECAPCQRGRRYHDIIAALPDADRQWMSALYDQLLDAESEREMSHAFAEKPDAP